MKVLVRASRPGPAVVPRDGLPCGVPGLAIVRADPSGYTITHVRSGCSAGWFPDADPEVILAAAFELGQLTDWTKPGDEVMADEEVAFRARAIVRAFGAVLTGEVGDGTDIHPD